jgi:ABC-type nitrate/sulfonate/bicarbonate transport system substrate-binding protein
MDRKVIIAIALAAIVVAGGTAVALLFMKGEKSGTVYYVAMAPKDMRAALSTGQVSAYIAWEPYVSDSVAGGVGRVLEWTSEIMPNHPCCVVVIRNAVLSGTNGMEIVKRFVKAHVEATEWMTDALAHPDGVNYTLLVNMAIQFTGRNATVVESAFGHIEYGYEMNADFRSSLEQFTDMYLDLNMTDTGRLADRGYSSVTDFISKYVNTSFLEAAASVAPTDTIINPDSPINVGYLLGDLHQMAKVVAENKNLLGTGKSFYETYGLKVQNATGAPYAAGGAEMSAFTAGTVDIGLLGAPPAILQHLNAGVGTTIVAQANSEGSGLVVVASSDIHSLRDLVNRTVAVPGPPGESSIQFLLLKIALQREGLKLSVKT